MNESLVEQVAAKEDNLFWDKNKTAALCRRCCDNTTPRKCDVLFGKENKLLRNIISVTLGVLTCIIVELHQDEYDNNARKVEKTKLLQNIAADTISLKPIGGFSKRMKRYVLDAVYLLTLQLFSLSPASFYYVPL